MKINKKLLIILGLLTASISVPSFFWISGNISNSKSAAYKRAKKIMDPDLYLTYRITERIVEANNIKRPIRIAVRKGVDCSGALGLDPSSNKCIAAQLLPDIDKTTNFDIWASQVINTMSGQANALASSDSGVLSVSYTHLTLPTT